MKISYDKVGSGYLHPLSKEDVARIVDHISLDTAAVISHIRFGHNLNTTQEGRVVKRGESYEIRVNFCVRTTGAHLQSRLLSDNRGMYLEQVKMFGGRVDLSSKTIYWALPEAKRYASYVLLHEIGHVVYCEEYLHGQMDQRQDSREEKWCDSFSRKLVKVIMDGA
jgi:hypothetical protein